MDEDTRLLLASRDDPAAFRLIYERWAEKLLAYFYVRVHDAEVAADLLAETIAVAYERRRHFRDKGKPGGAWLYGVARNELSHYFRKQAVDRRALTRLGIAVPQLDAESIARIEEMSDAAAYEPQLTDALARMSSAERSAVELRVLCDLDYDEIGRRLGCTEGSARTRVHRGLSRLAALMEVTT